MHPSELWVTNISQSPVISRELLIAPSSPARHVQSGSGHTQGTGFILKFCFFAGSWAEDLTFRFVKVRWLRLFVLLQERREPRVPEQHSQAVCTNGALAAPTEILFKGCSADYSETNPIRVRNQVDNELK